MAVSPLVVLLHSPLTTAAAWGDLPDRLRTRSWDVATPDITDDNAPPYAGRYVAEAAKFLMRAVGRSECVLVGHSGAGPLLPQIGFARQAAQAPVSGYLFVDAGLPRVALAASRLDLMRLEDEGSAAEKAAHLESGGRFPDWSDDDLAGEIPRPDQRSQVLASVRPRGLDFFTEPLLLPEDWPDAPTGFLQLSGAYERSAATARQRGWPVRSLPSNHFAAVTDPDLVAFEVDSLLREALGPS